MSMTDLRAELRVRPVEARARILEALRSAGTIRDAAAVLGCNLRTLQRMLAEDEALARAAHKVRSDASRHAADVAGHRWA